jgi:CheY-like chemotaxis protein
VNIAEEKTKPAPVLYVEDEENDVLFMKRAFASLSISHPLRVARDGREAIEYLKNLGPAEPKPCLVLLDLNLPLISGFEVLDWIRAHPAYLSLPVVIISSSGQPTDKIKAREKGANDYSIKPATPSQLGDFARRVKERWLVPG